MRLMQRRGRREGAGHGAAADGTPADGTAAAGDRRWRAAEVVLLLVAGLLAPSVLGGLVRPLLPGDGDAVALLASPIAVVAVVLLARRRGRSPRDLGLRRPRPGWLLPTLVAAPLLVLVNVAVGLSLRAVGGGRLAGASAAETGLAEVGLAASPLLLGVTLLIAAVLAPIEEELLFRGVLQAGLVQRFGALAGILLAATAFLLAHGEGMGAFHLVAGVAYGWIAHRTGSIWPAVVLHGVNNAAVVLLVAVAA
jgi:uncharacterized protein